MGAELFQNHRKAHSISRRPSWCFDWRRFPPNQNKNLPSRSTQKLGSNFDQRFVRLCSARTSAGQRLFMLCLITVSESEQRSLEPFTKERKAHTLPVLVMIKQTSSWDSTHRKVLLFLEDRVRCSHHLSLCCLASSLDTCQNDQA